MLRRTFLFGAASSVVLAQAPIRVQVNEVIIPVTVTDDKGRFVTNLTKSDFRIYDEGKEQQIASFQRENSQPVVAGVLLDQSNAMRIHWEKYKEAATELILALLPGDKKYNGFLITYGTDAELQADTSDDPEKMMAKLEKLKPAGGSALFDAIYLACKKRTLLRGEPYDPRRVLIIIGDGHDTASQKSLDEVLELAQRSLVTIYGMSTAAFGMTTEGQKNLERLANETGGRVEYPLNNPYKDVSGYISKTQDAGNYELNVGGGEYEGKLSAGLIDAVRAISGEITTQYVIRYRPDLGDQAADPKITRKVRVSVNLPGVNVRYRSMYYPYSL